MSSTRRSGVSGPPDDPDEPALYVFVADEPVYISQVAPFTHYRAEPWPGTIFGSRFLIDV